MRIVDPLLMELDREAATTGKLLAAVPEDKLDWRPHAKSRSIGELAMHIATVPGFFGANIHSDGLDAGGRTPPEAPKTNAELLEAFRKNTDIAKQALATMDDEKVMGMWAFSYKGKPVFAMPRVAVIRTLLLSHCIHHRGQLSVYLRLLDVSLPSIYGPTADENPFA